MPVSVERVVELSSERSQLTASSPATLFIACEALVLFEAPVLPEELPPGSA